MSNTARKYRKKVQQKLRQLGNHEAAALLSPRRPARAATPVEERAYVTAPVYRRPGDAMPTESLFKAREGGVGKRARARVKAFIEAGGIKR